MRSRRTGVSIVGLATIMAVGSLAIDPSATAAAAPYRTSEFELGDLRRTELPWTAEPRLGFPARRPRDRHGVPMIVVNGHRHYRPGALAINSMKRLDAYIEEGDERQLEQALKQARRLRGMVITQRDAWWIPFRYDYPPAAQRGPWVNAMSQGLVLSLFVRLHRVTGDDEHLDAARKVFRSFLRLRRPGHFWVSWVTRDGYLWLEHYPRARPDHVLNAHLHAIFGIYEFWQVTRSRKAKGLLQGAITTMRDQAHRFRRSDAISYYDMGHRSVILKYHQIHVWQFRLLARISGDAYFWRLADRLAGDARPAGYVPGRPSVRRKTPWPPTETTARAAQDTPAPEDQLRLGAPSPGRYPAGLTPPLPRYTRSTPRSATIPTAVL